ncbi:MAG: 50S ribosomal protein L21 [Parcubacteria group bacterium ADurb.Bin316]|nr:MAG: 50S ribosomal protein L21 [Parcubacteria group bacterium ADurb.Bin316]HOZ56370.1 50S ribosomal protein L21 [bacterium]
MTKIAVIKTGGKQYKVKEGDSLKIEKLKKEVGGKVNFDTLLIADEAGKDVNIGDPSLGDKVKAEILENGKGKKVTVVKYKNKTRYLRTRGHRQEYSKIRIDKIG